MMQRSDILKLKKEVLDYEAEAALPANLSDEWVKLLARDLENLRVGRKDEDENHSYLTAPLAIIMHIFLGKNGGGNSKMEFSNKELDSFLDYLQFEISIEIMRRWTEHTFEPATLETIFTDREVKGLYVFEG